MGDRTDGSWSGSWTCTCATSCASMRCFSCAKEKKCVTAVGLLFGGEAMPDGARASTDFSFLAATEFDMKPVSDRQEWEDVLGFWFPEGRSLDVDARDASCMLALRMQGGADDEIVSRFPISPESGSGRLDHGH